MNALTVKKELKEFTKEKFIAWLKSKPNRRLEYWQTTRCVGYHAIKQNTNIPISGYGTHNFEVRVGDFHDTYKSPVWLYLAVRNFPGHKTTIRASEFLDILKRYKTFADLI